MTYSKNISDFISQYALYDRFVEKIESVEDEIVFTFDLSHCDDPRRDDDSKSYILTAAFQNSSIIIAEGEIPQPNEVIGGEILKVEEEDGKLRMGIEWRLRSNKRYSWTELLFLASPSRTEEVVVDAV